MRCTAFIMLNPEADQGGQCALDVHPDNVDHQLTVKWSGDSVYNYTVDPPPDLEDF